MKVIFFHCRQLEDELQAEKRRNEKERENMMEEIVQLRLENEKLKSILSQNLSEGTASQVEGYLQHEAARLTAENLVSKLQVYRCSQLNERRVTKTNQLAAHL